MYVLNLTHHFDSFTKSIDDENENDNIFINLKLFYFYQSQAIYYYYLLLVFSFDPLSVPLSLSLSLSLSLHKQAFVFITTKNWNSFWTHHNLLELSLQDQRRRKIMFSNKINIKNIYWFWESLYLFTIPT